MCELQLNNTVMLDLANIVESRTLKMGPEKLAEGRWRRWVEIGTSGEMDSGAVWITGDQQPMGLTRHPNVQHDRVGLWLMDLLYPAAT